ncbi:MAG: polysaccharide deacetylase family protein [Clostridia bacterium]|nr:polysaccharide deacetylase family protein [Clostridia bacterium]
MTKTALEATMKYMFLRFPEGKTKAVTFSYDDGCREDAKLSDILSEYGIKCTFNLVGQRIERADAEYKDTLREKILARGHEIANHGYSHRALNKIRSAEGIGEVLDCRRALEAEFGGIIRGFAYPDTAVKNAEEYKKIKTYLEELDIAYARNIGGDNDSFELPEDFHNWMATAHHDNPNIMEYVDKFVNLDVSKLYKAVRSPKLFMLWGHSVEFERKGNWEHLRDICGRLGGKSDTWYATCMEIYDYVTAYNSLIYTADSRGIYNPTLVEIFFDVDGELHSIKPGELIKIN